MNLASFKKELERKCGIYQWQPTESQLIGIAREIHQRTQAGESLRKSDLQGIVGSHVPGTLQICTEGIDNSDLNTLLLLATKIISNPNG